VLLNRRISGGDCASTNWEL